MIFLLHALITIPLLPVVLAVIFLSGITFLYKILQYESVIISLDSVDFSKISRFVVSHVRIFFSRFFNFLRTPLFCVYNGKQCLRKLDAIRSQQKSLRKRSKKKETEKIHSLLFYCVHSRIYFMLFATNDKSYMKKILICNTKVRKNYKQFYKFWIVRDTDASNHMLYGATFYANCQMKSLRIIETSRGNFKHQRLNQWITL